LAKRWCLGKIKKWTWE